MGFISDKIELELKNILSGGDLVRFKDKLTGNVENLSLLNSDEEKIINNVISGNKTSFSHSLWGLAGRIDTKEIMRDYNTLLREYPDFRTYYLYDNLSEVVKVVYFHTVSSFPINDISNMDSKSQTKYLEKFVTSKAKLEYNPEESSIFNLQGFLIDKDKLLLWVGSYSDLWPATEIKSVINRVFNGFKIYMTSAGDASDNETEVSKEKVDESVNHWIKTLMPLGKPLIYPGETNLSINSYEKNSVYKAIDKKLNDKINEYCKAHKVRQESVWLLAWGYMLGFYNHEATPLIAAETRTKNHFVAPLKIARDGKSLENIKLIDESLEASRTHGDCNLDDICDAAKIDKPDYFKMLHTFISFESIQNIDEVVKHATEVNLADKPSNYKIRVLYYFQEDEVGLYYLYYREAFYDSAIDNMHKLLIDVVTEIVSSKDNKYDKDYFENAFDSNVEKLRKKDLINKAYYLKESKLFGDRSDEDLLIFAEKAQLRRYSANDEVLKERSAVRKVGILASGVLEESRVDMDGVVHTIKLCKPYSIFAFEGLFEENVVSTSYTVYSDEARVLWIERPDMLGFLNSYPDTWVNILKASNDAMVTMKKLWTSQ